MSRDPIHPVTLAVIVDASEFFYRPRPTTPPAPDGWVQTFYGRNEKSSAVRTVSPAYVQKWLTKIFSKSEFSLYTAVDKIRCAYEREDALEFQRWYEEISPWLVGTKLRPKTPSSDPRWKYQVRATYAALMNKALMHARIVMWLSDAEQQFVPGIYCPDWKTAAFASLFNGGLRVCPKCGAPFTPKKSNQVCCTAAHGVAYRTARSRWRKKQK
jgi:hypothetical protein